MSGLRKRLGALEGKAGLSGFWQHEDWVDYLARKERGECLDHITPRSSPDLIAFLESTKDGEA